MHKIHFSHTHTHTHIYSEHSFFFFRPQKKVVLFRSFSCVGGSSSNVYIVRWPVIYIAKQLTSNDVFNNIFRGSESRLSVCLEIAECEFMASHLPEDVVVLVTDLQVNKMGKSLSGAYSEARDFH